MKFLKELPGLIFGVIFLVLLSPIILASILFLGIVHVFDLMSNNKADSIKFEQLTKKTDSPEIIANIYAEKIRSCFLRLM